MAAKPLTRGTIRIKIGTTYHAQLAWKRKNPVTGVALAVDLTGYDAKLQVRKEIGASDVLLELSTDAGTLDTSTGVVLFMVPHTITGALDPLEDGVTDLLLTSPDGIKTNLVGFKVYFDRTATYD